MNTIKNKQKALQRTSWISVWGNLFLSALKIVVGLLAGSLSTLSDGMDSATDVLTSVIILITSFLVSHPPNSKYVYGREKAENMASTILSFVILFMGIQLFITAIGKLLHPRELAMPSFLALWAVIVSIVGKLLLSWYQFRQGRRLGSSMLQANAVNMRNDVILSAGVLVGLLCTHVFHLPVLDPIVAMLVSLFIVWSAIGIFRSANLVLMDGMKNTKVYHDIIRSVEKVPGAENPHRIRTGYVGNRYNIVLDIEVDGNLTLTEAHRVATEVETSIKQQIENVYDIVVHVEPKGNTNDNEQFGVNKRILTES
ncbi:MAG: cation diffusion facilitator family transporter [Bacteroidales bacterium]|jgi:cation diffusion facilitator family transporter|nr:cation diffusion facilitator family transporter [Bacteroidales bacterium]